MHQTVCAGSGFLRFGAPEADMTREQVYTQQLKALGIYEPAFDPVIKDLAMKERKRQRAQKEWAATVPRGEKPSFLDPLFGIIEQLDREILIYRETLGLTPKALRRLRGTTAAAAPDEKDEIGARLDRLLDRCNAYSGGVSISNTEGGAHG